MEKQVKEYPNRPCDKCKEPAWQGDSGRRYHTLIGKLFGDDLTDEACNRPVKKEDQHFTRQQLENSFDALVIKADVQERLATLSQAVKELDLADQQVCIGRLENVLANPLRWRSAK